MNNTIFAGGAPFLVGGARASIVVPRIPELSLFLLPVALISALVCACILLVVCVPAGGVVGIYNVVVVIIVYY